jgi:hypothetical protein
MEPVASSLLCRYPSLRYLTAETLKPIDLLDQPSQCGTDTIQTDAQ